MNNSRDGKLNFFVLTLSILLLVAAGYIGYGKFIENPSCPDVKCIDVLDNNSDNTSIKDGDEVVDITNASVIPYLLDFLNNKEMSFIYSKSSSKDDLDDNDYVSIALNTIFSGIGSSFESRRISFPVKNSSITSIINKNFDNVNVDYSKDLQWVDGDYGIYCKNNEFDEFICSSTGASGGSTYSVTKYLKAEKDNNDIIYVYNQAVLLVNGQGTYGYYSFYGSPNDQPIYGYYNQDTENIDVDALYNYNDSDIFNDYSSKIYTFKHTFKKSSVDNKYYWQSTSALL